MTAAHEMKSPDWWALAERAEIARGHLALYRKLLHDGDLCFDIGANNGYMTWAMRQLGCRVVAVEPLLAAAPHLVPHLRWRFGDDPLVTILPMAITPSQHAFLQVQKNQPYLSSISVAWTRDSVHKVYYNEKSTYKREVPTGTLEGLVETYGVPAFVKIDVEGAEVHVASTLQTAVPLLSLEYHQDWIPVAALNHLDRLGEYRYNYTLDNRSDFELADWVDTATLLFAMGRRLVPRGKGSWGDIYGRLK